MYVVSLSRKNFRAIVSVLPGVMLAVLAAVAPACGDHEEPTNRTSGGVSIVDGFETMCTAGTDAGGRSATLRQDVLFGPPKSCGPNMPACGAGSYCKPNNDQGTAGVCWLECDPTEPALRCPSANQYCSCDGRCVATAGAPDGGTPANSLCPRDPTLLNTIQRTDGGAPTDAGVAARVCRWNDECPYGSRCDQQTGVCKWNCLSDTSCMGGQTCSCLGQCISLDAGVASQPSNEPTLAITPQQSFLIPKPALPADQLLNPWGAGTQNTRTIQVVLTTSVLTATDGGGSTGPQPSVSVQPDANLSVKCPGDLDYRSPGVACALSSWSYVVAEAGADPIRATKDVSIRVVGSLSAGSKLPPEWMVRVHGDGVAGAPATVSFRYAIVTPTSPTFAPVETALKDIWSQAKTFRGTVGVSLAAGGKLDLPVIARIRRTGSPALWHYVLWIYDRSRFLSPNGLVGVDYAPGVGSVGYNPWVLVNDQEHKAYYQSNIQLLSLTLPAESTAATPLPVTGYGRINLRNAVSGEIQSGASLLLSLEPVSADLFPDCSLSQCPGGQVCLSSGICVEPDSDLPFPGIDPLDPALAPYAMEAPLTFSEWQTAGFFADTSTPDPSRVWCGNMLAGFSVFDAVGAPAGTRPLSSKDIPCEVFEDTPPGAPKKLKFAGAGPFPFAHRPDLEALDPAKPHLNTDALFDACWDEVNRKAPAALNGSQIPGEVFDFKAECVNIGTFAKVANLVAQSLVPPPSADRLLVRGAQQWLKLHSFLARQGLETRRLDQVLLPSGATTDPAAPASSKPSLSALINRTDLGISAILDSVDFYPFLIFPSGHVFLDAAMRQAATADYRAGYSLGPCGTGSSCVPPFTCQSGKCSLDPSTSNLMQEEDQTLGFAPSLLDALTGYLLLVEADLDETAAKVYSTSDEFNPVNPPAEVREALSRYGQAVRRTVTAQMAAQSIFRASAKSACNSTTCTNGGWEGAWTSASLELQETIQRAATAAGRLAAGVNPLGISEDDTPLFFSDVQGTNSRYFASSDYLLNGWADPAVKSAQSALDAARNEWRAARDHEVGSEQRTDDLATKYGTDLLENCGPVQVAGQTVRAQDAVDAFMTAGINPRTCFVKSRAECPNLSKDIETKSVKDFTVTGVQSELCRLDYARRKHWLELPAHNGLSCFFQGERRPFCSATVMQNCVSPKCTCSTNGNRYSCDGACQGGFAAADCAPLPDLSNLALFCPANETTGDCTTENGQHDKCVHAVKSSSIPANCKTKAEKYAAVTERNNCTRWQTDMSNNIRWWSAGESVVWRGTAPGGDLGAINIDVNTNTITSTGTFAGTTVKYDCSIASGSLLSSKEILELKSNPERWYEASVACANEGFAAPLALFDVAKLPTSCLQGRLGDAVKQITLAVTDAKIAQRDLEELTDRAKEHTRNCEAIGDLQDAVRAKYDEYLDTKNTWGAINAVVGAAQSIAVGAMTGGVSTALESSVAVAGISATSSVTQSSPSGLGSGLGSAGGGLLGFAAQRFIDDAEQDYQKLAMVNAAMEFQISCKQDVADLYRLANGMRLRIQRAAQVVDAERLKFQTLQDSNVLALRTAERALDREKVRNGPNFAYQFWYKERVERFHREMEWARRLTFLAMRAVEYELQQSLDLRSTILSASHPDELESAVRSLRQEQGSRTINRRRPEEASIVLSLRDDVLQVQDRSNAAKGERNWNPAKRFKGRLSAPQYSVWDKDGNWLGQGIPFNLKETGILESRCGERMWRVTATVQGDGLSPLEPGTPLLLLKRNTAMSQFCDGKGPRNAKAPDNQTHYQVSSIRLSSELLKGNAGREEDVQGFSTAMLYPWFNVRRFDFYSTDYKKGASEELAGRGLYGDYVLLFPKQVLNASLNPPHAAFPLDNVEDVLLRIDYLSVDDLAAANVQPRSLQVPADELALQSVFEPLSKP
jgi:hypothetical protein